MIFVKFLDIIKCKAQSRKYLKGMDAVKKCWLKKIKEKIKHNYTHAPFEQLVVVFPAQFIVV